MGNTVFKHHSARDLMVCTMELWNSRFLLTLFSSATVYRAINLIIHKPYAIKLEPCVNGTLSIEQEYYILKQLMGLANIVKTHWFGCEANFDALVLDELARLSKNCCLNKRSSVFPLYII